MSVAPVGLFVMPALVALAAGIHLAPTVATELDCLPRLQGARITETRVTGNRHHRHDEPDDDEKHLDATAEDVHGSRPGVDSTYPTCPGFRCRDGLMEQVGVPGNRRVSGGTGRRPVRYAPWPTPPIPRPRRTRTRLRLRRRTGAGIPGAATRVAVSSRDCRSMDSARRAAGSTPTSPRGGSSRGRHCWS